MDDDGRPDPDALLASLSLDGTARDATQPQERARGHLKIFLGAAPGVGKTWEMLNQARRRAQEGVAVLAGVIETHGRLETEAQLEGIAQLPRERVTYRGRTLEEFDLEGALARAPALLLVDELAHTNALGSRHAKRWEDVVELLDAGIGVWTTLNVQHLESLNDDVVRITGIRPSETLPDRVLARADEIELVDLPPAELRQRLADGKIYRPENARRALDGFCREGKLAALREIALRRAAAHVDEDVQAWMRRQGIAGPWPAGERVVALIGPDGAADAVVRAALRLAQALHAPWSVLHVERAGRSDAAGLRGTIALASQLGAELDLRASSGPDLVSEVIAASRARNATHLVIGRGRPSWWRRISGRSLGHVLLARAPDFSLTVVPAPSGAVPVARAMPAGEGRVAWAGAVGVVGAITGLGVGLRGVLPEAPADMAYLAGIVLVATVWGARPAMLSAGLGLLAWDFFFIPPLYAVAIGSKRDLVTAAVFAGVALLTGSLAGRVRMEMRAAASRIEGLRRIGAFSRTLGEPATEPELLAELARQAAALSPAGVVLTGGEGMPAPGPGAGAGAGAEPVPGAGPGSVVQELALRAASPSGTELDAGAMAAARWAWVKGEQAGRGTKTLPGAGWRFLPLQTVRGRLGVMGVRLEEMALADPLAQQTLEALADQASVALERVRLAASAARASAMEETHRLRAALLASLGHDLRTPLAGIQGAAGTLRGAWDGLDDATREDLLSAIEEDVARMARFLGNITDLTRLEGGDLRPRPMVLDVASVIEEAVQRMPNALTIAVSVEPGLAVVADPGLLEQALANVLDNARKYGPDQGLVRVRAERVGSGGAPVIGQRGSRGAGQARGGPGGPGASGGPGGGPEMRAGRLSFGARGSGDAMVEITVSDEGVGIPPEDLAQVFDSFFRVRRADRTAPGVGLGLAIARGFVEAMGGTISARSPNPNASIGGLPGTQVTLRLAAAAPEGAQGGAAWGGAAREELGDAG